MLNTLATEALVSASYVDDFIDSSDHIPEDIQRSITRIKNIDIELRGLMEDMDHFHDLMHSLQTSELNADTRKAKRQRYMYRLHQTLIRAQEMGDDKMHLVNHVQELIDNKARQIEMVNQDLNIREDLQQTHAHAHAQQVHSAQGEISITPAKPAQSPLYNEELLTKNYSATADGVGRILGACGKDSAFTPYNVSGIQVPQIIEVGALSANNALNNETGRGNTKRTRRRNDTATDYEPFSTMNECGNSGINVTGLNERPSTSRAISLGSQKKNTGYGNSNMIVANTALTASNGQTSASSVVSGSSSTGKKKKRKAGGRHNSTQSQTQTNTREDTPPMEAIDPDEPTYCICNQISYGEMILCDNDLCPIEWFHFSCVSLVLKPKGKWYCPNCRGDRPNVMKPKAQFLKELERFNKEKEEKT